MAKLAQRKDDFICPTEEGHFIQKAVASGRTHSLTHSYHSFCCAGFVNGEVLNSLMIEDGNQPLFMKKVILLCDLVLNMYNSDILPGANGWINHVAFHGDVTHTSNFTIHCSYTRLDELLENSKCFTDHLIAMSADVVECIRTMCRK